MATGNQRRRGARTSNKKGMVVGSGGQRRKQLKGKGPTPRAEDRVGHSATRRPARGDGTAAGGGGAGGRSSGAGVRTGGGRSGGGPSGGGHPGGGRSGGGRPAARRRGQGRGASTEVVVGRNSVLEALRTGVPASALHVGPRMESDDRVKESISLAADAGIPVMETPRAEMDRLTDGAAHQGLALTVPPYDYAHPDDLVSQQLPGTPLVVALDGITDPRNLGAIIRSVGAFGGHGVVVPARRSVGMTAAAWKTSAGAAARIPVAQATNLTRALEAYRQAGFFVVGLDSGGDMELPGLALADQPLVVVVGSEGKGLSRLVRETCDQIVSIPMASGTESLNAGIATAVTLYEVARSRGR